MKVQLDSELEQVVSKQISVYKCIHLGFILIYFHSNNVWVIKNI